MMLKNFTVTGPCASPHVWSESIRPASLPLLRLRGPHVVFLRILDIPKYLNSVRCPAQATSDSALCYPQRSHSSDNALQRLSNTPPRVLQGTAG